MLRRHPTLTVAALIIVTTAGVVRAQPAVESTTLVGTIEDASGARIAGATVILRSDRSPRLRIVESSVRGEFEVTALAPGSYTLTATASGFADAEAVAVVPASAPLVFVLRPAAILEEVRVTSASRQDELRALLNTRVDVVLRARIDDAGAQTVGEVLRELPGVLTRRGSEGAGAAGHQIQGIDSKQVLVLLDGLPLVGARGVKRGGAINLDRQSSEHLERVEVVKGAASALYGSDAIGGVINLVTEQARSPLHVRAVFAGGSRGDANVVAETGARTGAWTALFTAERHQSNGFDLTPTTPDTTAAPFKRVDLFGKLRWTPTSRFGLTALATGYANHATGQSIGELGAQDDDIHERTVNAALSADWLASPSTSVQVRGFTATFDEESAGRLAAPVAALLEPGALSERLLRADVSVAHVLGTRQHLQGGVEYLRDRYAGINRLRNDAGERASTSVAWLQHRLSLGSRLTTTAGVRVDHHSEFGEAVSPKVGVNARVVDGLHLRASYGHGFRAPDIGQLFYRFLNPTNFYQIIGNPHLTPERARSLQLGAEFQRRDRRARFGVNAFRNEVRDLIESFSLGFVATPAQLQTVFDRERLDRSFRPVLGRLLFTYKNVNDAVTQGVELDGEAALSRRVSLGGAYTYLDANDDKTGLELTGRHRHHGHARITWQADEVGLRANIRATMLSSWIAARATTAGVIDTRAPGFVLVDTFVSQRLRDGLNAFLSVDNLMDDRDPNTGVVVGTVPAPIFRPEAGRTFRVGVRWSWSR